MSDQTGIGPVPPELKALNFRCYTNEWWWQHYFEHGSIYVKPSKGDKYWVQIEDVPREWLVSLAQLPAVITAWKLGKVTPPRGRKVKL